MRIAHRGPRRWLLLDVTGQLVSRHHTQMEAEFAREVLEARAALEAGARLTARQWELLEATKWEK